MNKKLVIDKVCEIFRVSIEDVEGKSHLHRITSARHFCLLFLHEHTDTCNGELANIFHMEKRSVIRAITRIKFYINNGDKEYIYYFNKIKESLNL